MQNGYAVSQLPERFQLRPRTKALHDYITAKYSKHGFRKDHAIAYNPEFNPHDTGDGREIHVYGRGDRYRWVEQVTGGLRKTGDAHAIVRLDHTGWFTDHFQDETVHGEVYQLPGRNRSPRYVAAVNDPCNDNCACVDFRDIYDDKEDAARAADSMAEQWAEREREYRAKEDAKQRLEDIEEEIKTEYADFRRIAKELRANCDAVKGVAVVRELVRDRWKQTKARIRKLRSEQSKVEREGCDYGD